AKGTAGIPRVARTMLRSVSSETGECSISIHKKSKPRPEACAATSTLFTQMIGPITASPRASFSLTGLRDRAEAVAGAVEGIVWFGVISVLQGLPDVGSLSNQTSDTWQPRPLPPRPGSPNQVRVSSPC